MDVSGKDFALNFRGFEHNDPETVQRFTAFCEANFALSPETVDLLRNAPDTIVLTHGGSVEELEALAKVLREIGAVVDVSSDSPHYISSLVGGPSTQELHRLFSGQSASENDDTPASCPYPPPLGRSLYLLSNSDAVVDRRSLRQRARQSATLPPLPTTAPSFRGPSLVTVSGFALAIGVIALLAAALLLRRDGVGDHSSSELPFQHLLRQDNLRRDAPKVEAGPARALIGSTSSAGFSIDLKVIASPSAVSISSLTFTSNDPGLPTSTLAVRRIIGEPSFLSQPSPGTWIGSIILSVFVEDNGVSSHVSIPASITVIMGANQGEARALIEVAHNTHGDSNVLVSKSDNGTLSVSGIPFVEISLS